MRVAVITLCWVLCSVFAFSQPNNSLHFDGNFDYVGLSSSTLFDFERTESFTIEMWFKTDAATGDKTLFSKIEPTGVFKGYELALSNGAISFQMNNVAGVNSIKVNTTATYADNSWHHVAVTYNGSSNASGVLIYMDGLAAATTTISNSLTNSISNAIPAILGGRSAGLQAFGGQIDEVRVWNGVRTSTEIASNRMDEICPSSPNLLVYYPCNEGKADGQNLGRAFLPDLGVNGINGSLNAFALFGNTSNWVTNGFPRTTNLNLASISNKSLFFNGAGPTDDRVAFVNNGPNISGTSFTIEFWAKREQLGESWIFSMGGNASNNALLHAGFVSNNTFRFSFFGSASNLDYTASNPFDFNWHHWACVFQTGVGKKIYLDGILVASDNKTTTWSGTTAFRLGGLITTDFGFKGSLDEFRVWGVTRTAAEINANKNCEISPNNANLKAYYTFNSNSIAGNNSCVRQLYDLTSNNHQGKLTNFALASNYSNWNIQGFQSYPISFTTQPNSYVKAVGSTVTFSAAATGACGTISYQWYKYNNIIAGATASNYTINNLQASDAGEYHVVVSDSVSNARSRVAFLTIQDNEFKADIDSSDAYVDINWTVPIPPCMLNQNNQPYTSYTTRLLRNGSEINATTYNSATLNAMYANALPYFNKVLEVKNNGVLNTSIPLNNNASSLAVDYTYEMWIKTANNNLSLTLYRNSLQSRFIKLINNKIEISLVPGDKQTTDTLGLLPNSWNHFAFVFNAANGNTKVYVNGQLKATLNVYFEFNSSTVFVVNQNQTINPEVGEIRIWDKALSSSEVSSNFMFLPPTAYANLLCRFRATETSGALIDHATFYDNGYIHVLQPNSPANVILKPFVNSTYLTGSYRDISNPNTTSNYTLQLFYNTFGQQDTDCSPWTSTGKTLPVQAPSLLSATDSLLDRIVIRFQNNSDLATSFKLYRGNQHIYTFSDSIAKGKLFTYHDVFNIENLQGIKSGQNYTYSVRMVCNGINQEFPYTIGTGKTLDIGFTASDAPAFSNKVQIMWSDTALAFIDEYKLYRNGNMYRALMKSEVAISDFSPYFGDSVSYELRLMKQDSVKAAFSDFGSVAGNGTIGGKVLTEVGKYPVKDVVVTATRKMSGVVFTDTTDASGSFSFVSLPYGLTDSFELNAVLGPGHTFSYPIKKVNLNVNKPQFEDVVILDAFNYTVVAGTTTINSFTAMGKSNQDKVNVSWDAASFNSNVHVDLLRSGELIYSGIGVPSLNYNFSDLTGIPNRIYDYQLRIYTIAGNNVSESSMIRTDTFPQVSNINSGGFTASAQLISGQPSGNVSLNWSPVSSNIDAYRIYRKVGMDSIMIAEVPEIINAYIDRSAPFNVDLRYSITSVRSVEDITFESTFRRTSVPGVINLGLFPAPVNVTASAIQAPGITITWNIPAALNTGFDYLGFYIYRNGKYIGKLHKTHARTFTDYSAIPNQNYTYGVACFKIDDNGVVVTSSITNAGSVTNQSLSAPAITAVNQGNGFVKLSWSTAGFNTSKTNYSGFKLLAVANSVTKEIAVLPPFASEFYYAPEENVATVYLLSTFLELDGETYPSAPAGTALFMPATSGVVLEPLNLKASRNLPNHVYLSWDYYDFVPSQFVVYRNNVVLDTLPKGSRNYYDFTAVANDETILYHVKAIQDGEESKLTGTTGDVYRPKKIYGQLKDSYGIGMYGMDVRLLVNGIKTIYGRTDSSGYYSIALPNEITGNVLLSANLYNVQDAFVQNIPIGAAQEYEVNFQSNTSFFPPSGDVISDFRFISSKVDSFNLEAHLIWSLDGNNCSGVEIKRGVGDLALLSSSTSLLKDTSAVPGIGYSYLFRSFIDNANGRSFNPPVSYEVSFPKLAAVINLSATPVSERNAVHIQFSHPFNHADAYLILRNDQFLTQIDKDSIFGFWDNGGVAGQLYKYTVYAFRELEGIPVLSDERSVNIIFPEAGKVKNLTASEPVLADVQISSAETDNSFNMGYVKLTWDYDGANLSYFKVYRNGEPLATVHKDSLHYEDYGGEPGTNYGYEVSAVLNQNGFVTESVKENILISYPAPARPYQLNSVFNTNVGEVAVVYRIKTLGIDKVKFQREIAGVFTDIDQANTGDYDTATVFTFVDKTGKLPETTTRYRLIAIKKINNVEYLSDYSQIEFNAASYPVLPPPYDVEASDGTYPFQVIMDWKYNPETSIDYFKVTRTLAGSAVDSVFTVAPNVRRFTDYPPIINGVTGLHTYKIKACKVLPVAPFEDCSAMVSVSGSTTPSSLGETTLQSGDNFGFDTAIDGQWSAVSKVSSSGIDDQIIMYKLDSSRWVAADTIFAPDDNARFGFSIAISDTTLVVGAPYFDAGTADRSGKIYIYTYRPSLNQWLLRTAYSTLNSFNGCQLGFDVAIDGNILVAGRPFTSFLSGYTEAQKVANSIVVFRRNASGDWNLVAVSEILPAFGDNLSNYALRSKKLGFSVAINNNTIVAGDIEGGVLDVGLNLTVIPGTAVIYEAPSSGNIIPQFAITDEESVLGNFSQSNNVGFGFNVAVNDDFIATTALNGFQSNEKGAVYIHKSTGTSFEYEFLLTMLSDAPANGNAFGHGLAIFGNNLLISEPFIDIAGLGPTGSNRASKLFLYQYDAANEDFDLVHSPILNHASYRPEFLDNGNPDLYPKGFGFGIDLSDHFILSGAPKADNNKNRSMQNNTPGKAYFFSLYDKLVYNVQASDGNLVDTRISWSTNCPYCPNNYISKFWIYRDGMHIGEVNGTETQFFDMESSLLSGAVLAEKGVNYYYEVVPKFTNNNYPVFGVKKGDDGFSKRDGKISGFVYASGTTSPIPNVQIIATAIDTSSTLILKDTAYTLADGTFTLDQLYVSASGLIYSLEASYLDHDFSNPVPNAPIVLSFNNPTKAGIIIFDETAYIVRGKVSKQGSYCGLEGIKVDYYEVSGNARAFKSSTVTDEDGNYTMVLNPNNPNINAIEISVSNVQEKEAEGNTVEIKHQFSPGTTLFGNLNNLPKTNVNNIVDELTYPVTLSVVNTCFNPVANQPVELRVASMDGCMEYNVVTNNDGQVVVNLVPQQYIISVEGLMGSGVTNYENAAINYLRIRPVNFDLQAIHDTAGVGLLPSLAGINFFYHTASQIAAEGEFERYLCNDPQQPAILEQGSKYTLLFSISENHRPGESCDVSDGYLVIYNGASEDPTADTLYSSGGVFNYKFTAGLPNIIEPYLVGMSIQYFSDLGVLLGTKVISFAIEGSRPVPGTGISTAIDSTEAGEIKLPIWILRDPPGDHSWSAIESGSSFSKSLEINNEYGGSAGFYTDFSLALGGLGFFVESTIAGGRQNENGASWEISASTSQRYQTSDSEYVIGRLGNIIVGTGLSTQFGITNSLKFENMNCDPVKSRQIQFGMNGFNSEFAYTVEFIVRLINRYRQDSLDIENGTLQYYSSDGNELSKDASIAKVSALISQWEYLLRYHDVEAVPHYAFCADTTYRSQLSETSVEAIDGWRTGFCSLIGSYNGNGEFMMNENIVWDQNLINAYNNTIAFVDTIRALDLENEGNLEYEVDGNLSFSNNEFESTESMVAQNFHQLLGNQMKTAQVYDLSGDVMMERTFTTRQAGSTHYNFSRFFEYDATLGLYGFNETDIGFGFYTNVGKYETKTGAKFTANASISVSKEQAQENEVTMQFFIHDDDWVDQVTFLALQAPIQNQTPYFVRLGGYASCPDEYDDNGNFDPIKIDDCYIKAVLDPATGATTSTPPPVYGVPSNGTAIINVELFNEGITDVDRYYYVFLDQDSNPFGAQIKLGGASLNNTQPYFTLSPGEKVPQILTVERQPGTPYHSFENLRIGVRPWCFPFPTNMMEFSVYFNSPCSKVSLSQPFNGYVVNRVNPNVQDDKETIPFEFRDYQSGNTSLTNIRIEYRRVGTTENWKPVPLPGTTISRAQLLANDLNLALGTIPSYFYELDITGLYTLFPDGAYLFRAYAGCQGAQGEYSNEVNVSIRRNQLRTIGLPQPSDHIWTSGDEISATYSTDIDCNVINNIDSIQDLLVLVDLTTMMEVPFDFVCNNNKITLVPTASMQNYDGHTLRATYKNIFNIEGNYADPMNWDFEVITQLADFNTNTVHLTLYNDEVKTVQAGILNTNGTIVNGLSLSENAAWLSVLPGTGFSLPASGQTIDLVVDGTALAIGDYQQTITLTGLAGRVPELVLMVHVITRPPILLINPAYTDSMNLVLNWSFLNPYGLSTDTLDQIQVYKDGTLRGFGLVRKQGAFYAANITVFGDAASDNNEPLDFSIWNADEAKGYTPVASTNVPFIAFTSRGTIVNPQVLLVEDDVFEYGGRIYVDSINVNGTHDGLSWSTAFHRLEDAIASAGDGDTIWVAKGTYFPTTGTDRAISFDLSKQLVICGGFATGNTSMSQRSVNNPTILSGDIGVYNNPSDNSYHVVKANSINAVLDQVIVQQGNANGSSSEASGGNIFNNGTLTLKDCIVKQGMAGLSGTLLYNEGVLKIYGGKFFIPPASTVSTLYNATGSVLEVNQNVEIKY